LTHHRKIDCIVVKDLSRFGRNYLETGNYLERIFPFLDVRFVAINDNFDTLTAERSNDGYIIPLKNIINAAYSKDISRKISSALTVKRQKGEFIGAWAAYGYHKCTDNPRRIEPDEETAPIVKDIFQWRLSGMSLRKIASQLNNSGIPSPFRLLYIRGYVKAERYANTKWYISTVKSILSNEVYLGHMVQGRERSGFREGKKLCKVQKADWIIVHDTHEPIIDEETFRAVQTIQEQCHAAYYARLGCYNDLGTKPNIFRGLIYCADCNRALDFHKMIRYGGRKRYYAYICPSHLDDPASCSNKYMHEEQLKELLWEALQMEISLAENMECLVHKYSNSAKAAGEEALNREIISARQALERAKMLYDSLYQNYVDRLFSEREYMEMKQQYKADMERAQARIDAAENQKRMNRQYTEKNPWLVEFNRFKTETELTEEMAHALIERVEIGEGNSVEITLRYRDEYSALVQLLDGQETAVTP